MITGDTVMGRLLDEHPELVDVLAAYNTHFEKLRNRLLRRVMAPRVTVAQAAGMAGVEAGALVGALRRAVGEPESAATPPAAEARLARTPKPAALVAIPEDRQLHVDVRADIARGEEPFVRIMAAVKALGPDQALVLRVPFEPIPLYGLVAKRGLAHWTDPHAADDWAVWFYHDGAAVDGTPPPTAGTTAGGARTVTIDVRELEPPLPMVLVLERLDTLADDEQLEVIHARRPMFLYPQLDERGFEHETDDPEPGVVRILIRRRAA